jgi:hypothetical protein
VVGGGLKDKGWIVCSMNESSTAVRCTLFACGASVSKNAVPQARTLHAAAAGGSFGRRSKLDITEGPHLPVGAWAAAPTQQWRRPAVHTRPR